MNARFQSLDRHWYIGLAHSRREGGKHVTDWLGSLGAVIRSEPVSISQRTKFWIGIDAHWRAIEKRHPGRVTPEERAKVEEAIARRVAKPTPAESRRQCREVAEMSPAPAKPVVRQRGVRVTA